MNNTYKIEGQKGSAVVVSVVVITVAAVVIYLLWMKSTNNLNQNNPSLTVTPSVTMSPTLSPTISPQATSSPIASPKPSGISADIKIFTVLGSPFKFSLNEIKVKNGETVKIVFKNTSGTHDWVVDEFNAKTKVLQAGQEEIIQFVADKKGVFEFYCSVANHRQMGMRGTLVVE